MTEALLTRLFRSIEGVPSDDIVKVAHAIIEDEKKKGHTAMASRLSIILQKNLGNHQNFTRELTRILPQGTSIPTNKRNNIPLAVEKERDQLRHEMILPFETENKIQRIEKEFVAQERLANFGLKPRKKILFYGSPGCGKSMAAERIAWNIGLPFLKVRFEAIVSSYLGESATNLRNLFDVIDTNPFVLLLDEFDFLGKSRNEERDVGEMHRIVNILLHLLEEYDAPGILVATTNLEGRLDKALFRRFDDVIEIPKPGQAEIVLLLNQSLSSIQLDKGINLKAIAKKLDNHSPAIIVKIAQDAAKLAVISGEKIVKSNHLETAIAENSTFTF